MSERVPIEIGHRCGAHGCGDKIKPGDEDDWCWQGDDGRRYHAECCTAEGQPIDQDPRPPRAATYDDPGDTVEANLLSDPLRYLPIPVNGDARRYPGDGNRHERRKAAAERRRGR